MLARKMTWLAVAIFLLAFSSLANSQSAKIKNSHPKSITQKKEWRVIDGFRSAKFGMTENLIKQAIAKDFKISKNKVKRAVHPVEKTVGLTIHLPELMSIGGPADIVYILGYKSRKLIQVNIDWGAGVTTNFNPQDVVDTGNLLRDFFLMKRQEGQGFKGGYLADRVLKNGEFLLFRGKDQKGRMTILTLNKSPEKGDSLEKSNKTIRLILSYMLAPLNPDKLTSKASASSN